jgi:hypothetical protein
MTNERHIHVLNLGAGVQSTTLYLMAGEGRLLYQGQPVVFDCAIFADTQEEPTDDGHNVYEHLKWLFGRGPEIIIGTAGKLGDHLMNGTNSTNHRFAPIPAFTLGADGKKGKVRRQCTAEYKIEVIEKVIRRQVLGLRPRQWVPRGTIVHQWIGISVDEAGRMMKARSPSDGESGAVAVFPLPADRAAELDARGLPDLPEGEGAPPRSPQRLHLLPLSLGHRMAADQAEERAGLEEGRRDRPGAP